MVGRPAVRRALWQMRTRVFGHDSPTARAAFGRYVASVGGALTLRSAGEPAWVAWVRFARPGFRNRAARKDWDRLLSRGHHLAQAWDPTLNPP